MDRIEESLDLATLFIEATNRHLTLFEADFSIGNRDERIDHFNFSNELSFSFDGRKTGFRISGYAGVKPGFHERISNHVGTVLVKSNDPLFVNCVRLVIASEQPQKIRDGIERFFAAIQRL